MTEAPDSTPLKDSAALLWDESRRQITRQEADLDTLRSRAVALLSVSSLVAGLFGARATTHHHPTFATVATVAALAFFSLSVLAILLVLAPKRKGWEFAQNLDQWFPRLMDGTLTPVTVTTNLARARRSIPPKRTKLYLKASIGGFRLPVCFRALRSSPGASRSFRPHSRYFCSRVP